VSKYFSGEVFAIDTQINFFCLLSKQHFFIAAIEIHASSSYSMCSPIHHSGIAVLGAAIFFGYMLALLKHRVQCLFSSNRVNPS